MLIFRHNFCFKIRDESGMNSNGGGGVGLWVDSSYDFELINELSIFIPHVYESIFVKVKILGGKLHYEVTLLGDLNINLLQFAQHNLTNQYLESLLLPVIYRLSQILPE